MKYTDVYSKLTCELATLIFFKRDGSVRLMLGTRNSDIIGLMHGFPGEELSKVDARSNVNNGNIGILDMIIGEGRSFNIDRLVSINYHGVINTEEELEEVIKQFKQFKSSYEATKPGLMDFASEMLD